MEVGSRGSPSFCINAAAYDLLISGALTETGSFRSQYNTLKILHNMVPATGFEPVAP